MADSFAEELRAQLDGIQAELERLDAKRRLIDQLLRLESGSAAATASSADSPPARRGSRRAAPKRPRLPRGLTTGKIREFLGAQREPVHATAILAYLERHEAAPHSAKPMATLQSNLQRLKEQGEIENTGRNHWRLRAAQTAPPAPAAPAAASTASVAATPAPAAPHPAAGPPVVRSTTTFGTRPGAGA
ncbi:MAG: hypothetical protein OXI41_13965 [Chloroflexota bacterium]|nr:hypothetical protein [Chloroflexota bacterium]